MSVRFTNEETILGVFGLAVFGLALYRLAVSINTEPHMPRLPASAEARVDSVVYALNQSFGKDWIRLGAGSIKDVLRDVLPASLLGLVDVVHMIEDHATHRELSGATKRWWAARQATLAGMV
jgi:hypothetical protein